MSRIIRALSIAATVFLFAPPALAQKTLVVAGYGGSWEQVLRKDVFPDFEARHGVKVEYTPGNSTDTLAKLQAQKANQQIDVDTAVPSKDMQIAFALTDDLGDSGHGMPPQSVAAKGDRSAVTDERNRFLERSHL